jgi:ubiquinone/menaquinone biosynthesis C-methylase UbiE
MAGGTKRRTRPTSSPYRGYSALNLNDWDRTAKSYEKRHRKSLAREGGKAWGTFRIPERRLRLLSNVRGKRVLELGCGAADWSIALARDGARAVGLDFSTTRLGQARERIRRTTVRVSLVRAAAEAIPHPDGFFDIVLSDYGATTFADPHRTVPEVARVLRIGGIFVFAHASPFRSVAEDFGAARLRPKLLRDYFGLRVLRAPESVEFQLPYGEWIRLFASCGFRVDRLIEPQAPSARQSSYFSARDQRWARRWPVESIWKLVREPSGPTSEDSRGA